MNKYEKIEAYLVQFLKDEVAKAGFSKVVLGISGGVDSAVVALLARQAFHNDLLGLMLPASTSSNASIEHASELCEKFGIRYEKIPVGSLVDLYFSHHPDASKLRIGNFSARMRMSVLYDISARENALVLGTGNKSEILLGYGTIFGDLACAINPIGNLYKTEIFELARHLGVPDSILNKAPSADLWEDQSDEGEFGFTYAQIDKVLFAHIEEKKDKNALIALGFERELVETTLNRIESNRFKGKLPTIADLHSVK